MNVLVRAAGTPLADADDLDPIELVRTIASARLVAPKARVRLSAGRLALSDEAQALCFVAGANSIFSGEKLLTAPNPGGRRRPAADEPAGPPISGMNPRQEFEDRLAAALAELRGAGLLRQMRLPIGIDLVSNDYLGLAEHPHLTETMRAGVADLPAGSGGSRLLRGHHEIFEIIEERLASFTGSESALLFGSGYAANIGLLQAVVSPDDLIVSDERNHASLIDGIRLTKAATAIYPHQDLNALEAALSQPRRGRAFVITESVFSMDGDLTPLREVCDIAERAGAVVIVDEAHATGMYGTRGSGRVEELGLRDRVVATMHTGGKALGSGGAWVAGSRALRDVMVNRARSFIFSTAPLPVLGAALGAGLDLVEREPERRREVHRKASLLRGALA